jgi:hypothetical protein
MTPIHKHYTTEYAPTARELVWNVNKALSCLNALKDAPLQDREAVLTLYNEMQFLLADATKIAVELTKIEDDGPQYP